MLRLRAARWRPQRSAQHDKSCLSTLNWIMFQRWALAAGDLPPAPLPKGKGNRNLRIDAPKCPCIYTTLFTKRRAVAVLFRNCVALYSAPMPFRALGRKKHALQFQKYTETA